MRRICLAAALALSCAACHSKVRSCKSGTAYLTLDFDAASAAADSLDVILSLGGRPSQTSTVLHQAGASHDTLEVDFDSYPAGTTLDVTVIASAGGVEAGHGHIAMELAQGCTALDVSIVGVNADLAAVDGPAFTDLAGVDLAGADLAGVDLAGADLTPTPGCPVIFVAPTGSDDSAVDGCATTTPVATIDHGIALAGSTKEVHVCKGSYSGFTLGGSAVVRGGYSCANWTRSTGIGYPTFDTTFDTVVNNANYVDGIDTVHLVGGAVTLDGLVINGAAAGAAGSRGLRVEGATTSAVITNCRVTGGTTSSDSGSGTTGVSVVNGAGADLGRSSFNGGTGSTNSTIGIGSVAVELGTSGTVKLHDNRIDGGVGNNSGSSPVAMSSVGLMLEQGDFTGAAAVQNNQINGGVGTAATAGLAPQGFGGVAVWILGSATVDLVNNVIDGGEASGGDQGAVGVYNQSTSQVNILGNRIFGGAGVDPEPSPMAASGIQTTQGTRAEIANNLIHGGQAYVFGTDRTVGVASFSNQPVSIHHNTIASGSSSGETSAVYVTATTAQLVVENNLLFGMGMTGDAVLATTCLDSGPVKSFLNNGIVNMHALVVSATACASNGTYDGAPAAESELTGSFAGASASGNFKVAASCSTANCYAIPGCSSPNTCMIAMFGDWNAGDADKSHELAGGWQLASTVPCAVTRGGADLTATIPKDIDQVARTAPVSMGAHEYDGACQ